MKFLMVCYGNICRSPMAEGILRHRIQTLGLPWDVDSAGIYSGHVGERPHRSSIKTCQAHGIDIRQQSARLLSQQDFEQFDIIYTMDTQVYDWVRKTYGSISKEGQIRRFLDDNPHIDALDVPDPWYGTEAGYEPVFQMIADTIDHIIEFKFSNSINHG